MLCGIGVGVLVGVSEKLGVADGVVAALVLKAAVATAGVTSTVRVNGMAPS